MRAYAACLALIPYLKVKAEQARLGIEMHLSCQDVSGSPLALHPDMIALRRSYADRLHAMNRRGRQQ